MRYLRRLLRPRWPIRGPARWAVALSLLMGHSMAVAQPRADSREAKVARLTQQIGTLHAAGKYNDALPLAEELAKEAKHDGRVYYGLAGLHARLGHADEAITLLTKAIKLHDVQPVLLEIDHDFDSLRDDNRFVTLTHDAARDYEKAQERVKAGWSVTLPSNYNPWKAAPLIVALHGYGGEASHMRRLWARVADEHGAVLLTPEGQIAADVGGKSWGGRGQASRDVLSANGETRRRLRIDSKRTLLTGFSQGGAMTYGVALDHPRLFRAIAPMAGPFSWDKDRQFAGEALRGLRVYIVVGDQDRNEIVSANRIAGATFHRAGAEVEMRIYHGIGHAMPPDSDTVLREVLKFVWADAAATQATSKSKKGKAASSERP